MLLESRSHACGLVQPQGSTRGAALEADEPYDRIPRLCLPELRPSSTTSLVRPHGSTPASAVEATASPSSSLLESRTPACGTHARGLMQPQGIMRGAALEADETDDVVPVEGPCSQQPQTTHIAPLIRTEMDQHDRMLLDADARRARVRARVRAWNLEFQEFRQLLNSHQRASSGGEGPPQRRQCLAGAAAVLTFRCQSPETFEHSNMEPNSEPSAYAGDTNDLSA